VQQGGWSPHDGHASYRLRVRRTGSGLRPSEQIALFVSDCDLVKGTIAITKARVMARDKDRTKTSEDRIVQLCPRALEVLKRQLALRERWSSGSALGWTMSMSLWVAKQHGHSAH
jgi:integrase